MTHTSMNRRTILKAASTLGALLSASGRLLAQQASSPFTTGPASPLPQRNEFVIRGANVLSLDPNIADVETGDVHVRDGVIVAVGPRADAPNAHIIDGRGTICLPGFVDTHW